MRLVTVTAFALILLLGAPALAQDGRIGGIIWEGGTTRDINVGWNFVYPTNCLTEFNGSTTTFFVFTRNPDGLVLWTNNPVFQNMLSPACQSGNALGFFVSRSGNTFTWNQIYTHLHR
jgi:hypothetical protein